MQRGDMQEGAGCSSTSGQMSTALWCCCFVIGSVRLGFACLSVMWLGRREEKEAERLHVKALDDWRPATPLKPEKVEEKK